MRFLQKPWTEQKKSLYFRWTNAFPELPVPLRLPFGAWWLVRRDNAGLPISQGQFEGSATAFLIRFLQPGMTVLDIGAHHGLYTLLASKRVGPQGKVFSFEHCTRERTALLQHLRINHCANVTVEPLAIGAACGDINLCAIAEMPNGHHGSANLAADIPVTLKPAPTPFVKLDDWLVTKRINEVDCIKLDVEGGELEVLKGALHLMSSSYRPAVLVDVQEVCALSWGYRCMDLVAYLRSLGFQWFKSTRDGKLMNLPSDQTEFAGSYVAVPVERASQVAEELPAISISKPKTTAGNSNVAHGSAANVESGWENPYDLLRERWDAVPTNNKEYLNTSHLMELSDQELLAKWEDSRRAITTSAEFGHRGWYHTLYAEFMRSKKVLDVGSGFGVDPITFAQLGAKVTFVDLVQSNLQILARLCKIMKLNDVQFLHLKDLSSLRPLDTDYDVIMGMGSLHNAPVHVMRPELHELLKHLKIGGRWLQLAYPESRWIRDGRPPFDKWGEWTDPPGAPWEEWYDVPKLLAVLEPFKFDVVVYQEIHGGYFNWFDLLYRGM